MDFSKKFVLAAETVSEYTVQKGEERHRMMIFDGHSDLLYDVTRRRLAGEDHVLERRHLSGLRAGGIGGLGVVPVDNGRGGRFLDGIPQSGRLAEDGSS